jgi:hypothetical protein
MIDIIVENLMLRAHRNHMKKHVYNEDYISQTSKRNVQNDLLKFLDLKAGPEYCFYYKCSTSNLIVFTCLIFGPALPILYFVGLVAIGVQYFIDRLALTYFYRLPPKYS